MDLNPFAPSSRGLLYMYTKVGYPALPCPLSHPFIASQS